jgi:holliday junction resolvase YEN1
VTRRPIRVAVDISIWLFQLQAGRGGQNPELRTLFFRLVRLLALPVHPLFVYDGKHKPPFKRGKATSSRSYGSAPIIRLSKILIDLFKFPRHEAPGEAEAECARLQQAGVVDAVMSNDIDTLMFGSGLTVMNFSKEKSTGTAAATHVDCYTTETKFDVEENIKLSRAGMILFAMLSGGDYLPSGVTKCGPGLAGEIAMAGFGEHLFEIINGKEDEINIKLAEWRERLQYELDMNESGYFQSKHKAVRIPDTFPDPQILSFYAKPVVSSTIEIENLRLRLVEAWDHEINALELRNFVADFFDWKYRSGARKLIRNLAEPLILTRLRLGKSPIATFGYGSYTPNQELPVLQRIYRSRAHFSTGCIPQVQLEMIPVDIVGLDLDAEEPNPPPELSQPTEPGSQPIEDEDETAAEAGTIEGLALKLQLPKKPYNPFESEKIWIFETVANLGVPEVVARWKKQEAEKQMPKKPAPKKTTTRKKKVIDPGMKPGGILRYTTITKPGSDMNSVKQAQILDATTLSSSPQQPSSQGIHSSQLSISSKASSPQSRWGAQKMEYSTLAVDDLASQFSMTCSVTDGLQTRVRSPSFNIRRPVHVGGLPQSPENFDFDFDAGVESYATFSPAHTPSPSPTKFKISYTAAGSPPPLGTEPRLQQLKSPTPSPLSTANPRRSRRIKAQDSGHEDSLETALESLHLSPSTPRAEVENEHDIKTVRKREPKLAKKKSAARSLATEDKPNGVPSATVSVPVEIYDDPNDHDQPISQPPTTLTETIRTHKGFWTVELREQEVTDLADGKTQSEENEGTKRKEPKKKRIARVSILDLS